VPALHPIHHSMRKRLGRYRPRDMDAAHIPHELSEGLTQIALDIFTDCANAGVPFVDALAAVYLSGLQHGSAIKGEIDA